MADEGGAVGLVEDDAADGQVGVRATGGFPEAPAEIRFEGVVAVEEGQVFARGRFDAAVAGGTGAAVDRRGGQAEGFRPFVRSDETTCHVDAAVATVVVDQDDFQFVERLRRDRFEAGRERRFRPVDGDDDGYLMH